MCERNQILELGLNVLAITLTLKSYGVVADVAFGINLECKGVSCSSLEVCSMICFTFDYHQRTFFLPISRGYCAT